MELSCQICSIPSTTHRLVLRSSPVLSNQFRRRSVCLASNSDTLVAGNSPEIVSKKDDEITDLKSWMHQNGLPACKVVLKDRPCRVIARPIHYVAASQDLKEGDIAFSVPSGLLVTLERVLGNQTVGKLLGFLYCSCTLFLGVY